MEIKIENLIKEYDNNFMALNQINLTMNSGMMGLLGANGAGKSTLIKILAGILNATSGEIILDGERIKKPSNLKKIVGYVPQKFDFYPQMTVYEVMDYFAALNGVKKDRKERIDNLLTITHLDQMQNLRTEKLSGGMRQRLGIAVALIKAPKLLLVDEPTVGLDPKERIHFNNVLTSFSKDKIILMSSHIVSDIDSTCNNLAILNHGSMRYNGTKEALIETCTGKVWEFETSLDKSILLEETMMISVKNVNSDHAILRVLSDVKPFENAKNVSPNLNDAYIFAIEENMGE